MAEAISSPGAGRRSKARYFAGVMLLAGGVPAVADAQAGGQEINSFQITPRVGITYDSNVFQLNSNRFEGSSDDVVITPAVSASLNRTIGRNSASLNVDVGYSLYDRYRSLDQLVVSGSGNGTLALTAYCLALPNASLTRQQNNLAAAAAIKNSQTLQDYSVTLACQRPFGFYPSVTVGYQSATNSQEQLELFNQNTFRASAGVGYAVPTIGSLLLSVGTTRIRQPNRNDVEGVEEGSNVFNAGLTFNRAVAPRISFSLGARYLSVDPLRAGTEDFDGIGYSASVDYHPSPRLSLILAANRDVTGSGDVAVSYVLASSYSLTSVFNISPRTTANASVQYFDRTYRGENPLFVPFLRGEESGVAINGAVSRSIGQRIQASVFASYSRVGAQGDFYDYNRVQAGASVGVRF